MTILLTNDDGVFSEGLNTLADALSKENKVVVVAPDGNRSASSHSLTIHKELVFKKEKISESYESFSLSGTPADCVKFAVHYFSDIKFDLVIAGINAGDNLGSNTLYSGTVAGAIEGNYFDIPSVAFSCASHKVFRFKENAECALSLLGKLKPILSGKKTFSVNFPELAKEQIKGVRFAPLGYMSYGDFYHRNDNGTYSLMGDPIYTYEGESDIALSARGYITITPILFDRTDYSALIDLSEGFSL